MTKRIINYAGAGLQDTDLLNMQRWLRYADSALVRAILGRSHSNSVVSGYAISYSGNMNVTISDGIHISHTENEDAAYGSLAASSNQIRTLYIAPQATVLTLAAPTVAGQATNYLIYSLPKSVDGDPSALFYSDPSDPTGSRVFRGVGNNGVAQNTTRTDTSQVTVLAGAPAVAGTQATPAVPTNGVVLYVVTVTTGQTVIDGTVGIQTDPTGKMVSGLLEQHHGGGINQAPQIDLTAEVRNKLPMANLLSSDIVGQISAVQTFAGDPNGHVAGNSGVIGGSAPSMCWDATNGIMYICQTSGTTATAVWAVASPNISSIDRYLIAGTTTLTVPAEMNFIWFALQGAGGAGAPGGNPTSLAGGGAGGGAGGYLEGLLGVTPGQVIGLSIGVGGSAAGLVAGTAQITAPSGGNTTLGGLTALGGTGGEVGLTGSPGYGGGAGGNANVATGYIANSARVGGDGTDGVGSGVFGGDGGSSPFGGGGRAGQGGGIAGSTYGTGGGGGYSPTGVVSPGGSGAPGCIKYRFYRFNPI